MKIDHLICKAGLNRTAYNQQTLFLDALPECETFLIKERGFYSIHEKERNCRVRRI